MRKVSKRPKRRQNHGILGLAEASQDQADDARIAVAELRKLLDPLGSRSLGRALGRLERHAAELDAIADKLITITDEKGPTNSPK